LSATSPALRASAQSVRLSRAELDRGYWALVTKLLRERPDLFTWAQAFHLEEGEQLDFDAFPFQVELHDAFGSEDLPEVSVMKSGQCGISAIAVSMTLWAGDVLGANVLYVLPGAQDAYDFSDSRVSPVIEADRHLSKAFAEGTDNKGLKRIGNAWIYFRGSVSEKKALSIPADILVLDEYDRLDQRNIPKYRKRLGSPKSLKLTRQFSNPSLPEFGIHKLFLSSDMRRWLIRCPACRHEVPIEYDEGDHRPHFVNLKKALRVCGKCSKPLPREAIGSGRWVAEHPGIGHRGYHISKLIVPDQNMRELIVDHDSSDEDTLQAHYNFDLGEPYSPRGGSLSPDEVRACQRDYQPPDAYSGSDWVTAGVDVGKQLHVRISRSMGSGRAAPLYVGTVPSFEELANLWTRYNVNFGVIDWQPEERSAREFSARFPGRVMLCKWAGEDQRRELEIDESRNLVLPRRTWAMDKCVAEFRAQTRLLPRHLVPEYVLQVTAPIRILQPTLRGEQVARYVSVRPADHFFFAESYDVVARLTRGGNAADVGTAEPETIRERVRRRR